MTLALGNCKILLLPDRGSNCYVGCIFLWLETAQALFPRNTARGGFSFVFGRILGASRHLQVQHVLQMQWHKLHCTYDRLCK